MDDNIINFTYSGKTDNITSCLEHQKHEKTN